jgi:membrane peptidoglycan carboxypeptidase
MQNDQHPTSPARLPAHSKAAAAQNLIGQPQRPIKGLYYPVPHHNPYPKGWRIRRHLRRRNLRRSRQQFMNIERIGTKWSMLPLAFGSLIVMLLLTTVLFAASAVVLATQQRFGQQITTLSDILPQDNLKMYDMHGTLIYQMVDQGLQTTVPLSEISRNLVNAEVATEDQYFWSNPGFDITGIVRAALANLSQGHIVSGGSTITQQLIKNTIVGNQDTIARKLQEIILAPEVSRQYTKEQILGMYLNTIYYGEQAYGAEAAAFAYFDLQDTPTATAASQLDIAQAAVLAGIPSAPIGRDPFLSPQSAFVRVQEVLHLMKLQGYITPVQERVAVAEVQQPHFLHHGIIHNDLAPHFASYAIGELEGILHVKQTDLSRSGLIVSTTLDLPLQNKVLKIAQQHISELAKAHNMSNAAEVMIDFHNGDIRVLLGNINPNDPQNGAFDVATQGYRQSGSSFKPFIYATAYAEGLSPGMPVLDAPFTIQLCCGLPAYTPSNYDLRFHGLVPYRYALQNSFNVPAVKLLYRIGPESALHTAQAMGISSYQGTPNYTMVLGTLGVHLLDETSAYGVFANGGVRVPAHAVDTIMDVQGNVVYHFAPIGRRVISKQVAFMMTSVLSDNQSRLYEFFDCNVLQLYSNSKTQCFAGNRGVVRPAAAKTGTSQDFRDNWTVGYTTDYVMGVWAGNNNDTPMVNVTGVDGAAPIWHDSMLLAEQGSPVQNFVNPGGLVLRTVHYPEGITTTDWYIKGLSWKDWGLGY